MADKRMAVQVIYDPMTESIDIQTTNVPDAVTALQIVNGGLAAAIKSVKDDIGAMAAELKLHENGVEVAGEATMTLLRSSERNGR